MTLNTHHARRLLAVVVSALALSGLGATAIAASATAGPEQSPAPSVQATTAWIAARR